MCLCSNSSLKSFREQMNMLALSSYTGLLIDSGAFIMLIEPKTSQNTFYVRSPAATGIFYHAVSLQCCDNIEDEEINVLY